MSAIIVCKLWTKQIRDCLSLFCCSHCEIERLVSCDKQASDIFNENTQKINEQSIYFVNFDAKRRIFCVAIFDFFEKSGCEKNSFIFWLFDEKSQKIVLFFDFFEKLVFENRCFFFENRQNL